MFIAVRIVTVLFSEETSEFQNLSKMLEFGRIKADRGRIPIKLKEFVNHLSKKSYYRTTQLNLIGECLLAVGHIWKIGFSILKICKYL